MQPNRLMDLRSDMLRIIMLFIIAAAALASGINIIATKGVTAMIMPLILCLVIAAMYYFRASWIQGNVVRLTLLLLINYVYLPIDWFLSLGMTGPMPYYAFLIIVLSLFFINRTWEIIIPAFTIVEVFILYYIELRYPIEGVEALTRSENLTILIWNFLLVAVTFVSIIYVVINHFRKNQSMFYELSVTDYLTKVFTRRYLIEHIEKLVDKSKRTGEDFQLIFMDIDGLKYINDTYGHLVGDKVLVLLGEVLNQVRRKYEICGRYGGDEFIVVLENITYEEACKVCERIRHSFQQSVGEVIQVAVTISTGISSGRGKSVMDIINEADSQMFKNKFHKNQ